MASYLGIDPTTSESKPSGCAVLDGSAALIYVGRVSTDAEIISLSERWSPEVVAIDSPLFLPRGLCCLDEDCPHRSCKDWNGEKRVAERELYRQGIRLYWTTRKTFIKAMVYRAMRIIRGTALGLLRRAGRVQELLRAVVVVQPEAAGEGGLALWLSAVRP